MVHDHALDGHLVPIGYRRWSAGRGTARRCRPCRRPSVHSRAHVPDMDWTRSALIVPVTRTRWRHSTSAMTTLAVPSFAATLLRPPFPGSRDAGGDVDLRARPSPRPSGEWNSLSVGPTPPSPSPRWNGTVVTVTCGSREMSRSQRLGGLVVEDAAPEPAVTAVGQDDAHLGLAVGEASATAVIALRLRRRSGQSTSSSAMFARPCSRHCSAELVRRARRRRRNAPPAARRGAASARTGSPERPRGRGGR